MSTETRPTPLPEAALPETRPVMAVPISEAPIDIREVVEAFRESAAVEFVESDPHVHALEPRMVETLPCPVCASEHARARFQLEGMRFQVVQCVDCGTGQMYPRPTAAEVASFYPPSYYGQPGAKFEPHVERLVRFVAGRHIRELTRGQPRGARVLDLGCGRGVLLSTLADRGFETHGVEISESAAAGADPRVDLRIVDSLVEARYPDDFFDQVIVWHVLEHLPNPAEVIDEIRRILKPEGRVVIAVPNFSSVQARVFGAAWFHLDLPRHLFHFPVLALRRLLASRGFDIRSEHHFSLRQNPFGWVQSLLNCRRNTPRNGLYELLHRRSDQAGPPFGRRSRIMFRLAYWLGMPLSLVLSCVTAMFQSGATVHLIATRRELAESPRRSAKPSRRG